MKKIKWLAAMTAFALASTCVFAACDGCVKDESLDDEPLEVDSVKLADFSNGKAETFFATDGYCNGSVFNVWWSADNVGYSDGAAHLTITDKDALLTECDYYSGELRSWQKFGYGDYAVSMKPLKKAGTASTFFTYTDEWEDDDGDGVGDPHDEIDIEFLGKDTTRVQFNYFVDGVGGHEYMYNLGFDASEEFHEYGFRWAEDSIVWFVDGKPVHKVEASEANPLPSAPGRIMMNHWCGTEDAEGWMDKYPGAAEGESADYKWVDTTAAAIGEIPEEPDVEQFEDDWDNYSAVELDFTTDPAKYTLTKSGTSTNVTYEGITNDYSNITADITAAAENTNWIHLTLKNNKTGTTPVVRVDINGTKPDGTSGCLNTMATMNGKSTQTDLEWGGSYFNNLPENVTIDAVIHFSGVAKTILIYFDSTRYQDPETYAGDVTVSDIKFAKSGELELPSTGDNDNPDNPDIGGNSVAVDPSALVWGGNIGSGANAYTVTPSATAINVTYESIDQNWFNVNANIANIAPQYSVFTTKITNNGSAPTTVRIDIATANGDTKLNVSATQDGAPVNTDLEWGGSYFYDIAAGQTVTAQVTYNAAGGPEMLFFFIDSTVAGTQTNGNVTFSDMAFSGTGATGGNTPAPDGDEYDISSLSWNGNTDVYTLNADSAAKALNVTYSAVDGSSYKNINANIASIASSKNVFTVKITNNGSETVNVRIDISTADGSTKLNQSATGNGTPVDTTDGSYFAIAAGQSVTVQITYNPAGAEALFFFIDSYAGGTHNGDITFTEMGFSGTGLN